MTNSVRILGSRAREQLPGTSITLLAPGFYGALTQLGAGVEPAAVHTLPIFESAARAEVMVAAQLSMHLEARLPEGRALRSRSAVAAYPRLIVPKRRGIAYALLQTDEFGVSSLIFPEQRDEQRDGDEAVFALTIIAERAVHRALRVLMWPESQVATSGASLIERWEEFHRPRRLAQLDEQGHWAAPDWEFLAKGPLLLLLHGTFGTPQSAFGEWLAHDSFARVFARYGGRCLVYAHPTLSASPEENHDWLTAQLPPLPDAIDVVAHGSGGLLARSLAADDRLHLRRVCLVGSPNHGTPLANAGNLGRFLDGHVALRTSPATLEGVLSLMRLVPAGVADDLPGIEALRPGGLLLRALATSDSAEREWFTVGAQFTRPDVSAAEAADPDNFASTPNDLVVPAEGCHVLGTAVAESLRLGGADAHHHNYFSNSFVRERLDGWLG